MLNFKSIWDKYFVAIIIGTASTVIGGALLTVQGLWEKIVLSFYNFYVYLIGYLYIQRVWISLLLVFSLLYGVSLLYWLLKRKKIKPWEKVKSVTFGGIRWRWDNYGFERIGNIRHFCEKCDYELQVLFVGGGIVLKCPMCNLELLNVGDSYRSIIENMESLIKWEHRKALPNK